MIRKIRTIVLGLLTCISTTALSTNVQPLTLGQPMDFELPSKTPQTLKNYFFWTINATCTVTSGADNTPVSLTMKNKEGTINGETIPKGEKKTILVSTGKSFQLSAVRGAEVELINQGSDTLKARCVA